MAIRVLSLLQVAAATLYCPDESEWQIGGGATWTGTSSGSGWRIQGGGGVQGMTSFNMLGGYLEFDFDNSGSKWGVNNNFYTISPDHPYTSYNDYCDGQGPEASSPTGTYCMELDIWEGNGNQEGATTVHTWFNRDGGCDMGGCAAHYSGGGQMHFRVDFDFDGNWHVRINDVENGGFNPYPSGAATGSVRDTMDRVGVTFVSSQWTGWVPGAGSVTGDLDNSWFSVSNLRISGQVLMGPTPAECSAPQPSPSPSPPSPPTPSPSGQCNLMRGKNNDGSNLKSSADSTSSAEACCSLCQSTSACVGFTWVHANNECWMKSAVDSPHDDGCGGCVTSGTVDGPSPPSPPSPPITTATTTTPAAHADCPGGSLSVCISNCPIDAAVYKLCVDECVQRCSSAVTFV